MSNNPNPKENALQRAVRLLAKLNKDLVEENSGTFVRLIINHDQTGYLELCSGDPGSLTILTQIFAFSSTEELLRFLDGDQLTRLGMVKIWLLKGCGNLTPHWRR